MEVVMEEGIYNNATVMKTVLENVMNERERNALEMLETRNSRT
jgi:hypothetical protein